MESKTRDDLVFWAKLADNADRYDEMSEYMNQLARMKEELSTDERNLFSVACKNSISSKRASWRILSSIETKEKQKDDCNEAHLELVRKYQKKVEGELEENCKNILEILTTFLIPTTTRPESIVFYYKMKGDYYRYLSEFAVDKSPESVTVASAKEAYMKAIEVSKAELAPTSPITLGLALNYSVFCFEILLAPDQACEVAKRAFDAALAELPSLSEEAFADAAAIMQLLRDNLTLWALDFIGNEAKESDA